MGFSKNSNFNMFNAQKRKAFDICRTGCLTKQVESVVPARAICPSRLRQFSQQNVRHHASPVPPYLPPSISSRIRIEEKAPKRPQVFQYLPEVTCVVRARIPTTNGSEMFLHLYKNSQDNKEHLAIVFGNDIRSKSLDAERPGETEIDRLIRGAYTGELYPGRTESLLQIHTHNCELDNCSDKAPLVRIHSECYTGETVWSARCDCGEQLDESAHLMGSPGNGGIIIYLRQEGRGIGLGEKLKAYNLQDLGSDTVEANLILQHPADARSYELATAMLLDLGQKEIRLLTNNPEKVREVEGPNRDIIVKERISMVPLAWKGEGGIRSREVEGYMKAKVSLCCKNASNRTNGVID